MARESVLFMAFRLLREWAPTAMMGDPKQLPAFVLSTLAAAAGLYLSLFERLYKVSDTSCAR